jgi:AcrR family transcriptional regulator
VNPYLSLVKNEHSFLLLTMPKVTQEYRDARRRDIAGAAMRLFARQGFAATSMADIIAESGLSAGAIYGHYKSKDELVHSAVTDLLDLRYSTIVEQSRGPNVPPPGQMMLAFLDSIESQVGNLGLLVQVWGQAVLDPTSRTATTAIGTRLVELWREYLADWFANGLELPAAEAADAAVRFAPIYLGVMQGCIVQSAIVPTFDRAGYLATVSTILPGPRR